MEKMREGAVPGERTGLDVDHPPRRDIRTSGRNLGRARLVDAFAQSASRPEWGCRFLRCNNEKRLARLHSLAVMPNSMINSVILPEILRISPRGR